ARGPRAAAPAARERSGDPAAAELILAEQLAYERARMPQRVGDLAERCDQAGHAIVGVAGGVDGERFALAFAVPVAPLRELVLGAFVERAAQAHPQLEEEQVRVDVAAAFFPAAGAVERGLDFFMHAERGEPAQIAQRQAAADLEAHLA